MWESISASIDATPAPRELSSDAAIAIRRAALGKVVGVGVISLREVQEIRDPELILASIKRVEIDSPPGRLCECGSELSLRNTSGMCHPCYCKSKIKNECVILCSYCRCAIPSERLKPARQQTRLGKSVSCGSERCAIALQKERVAKLVKKTRCIECREILSQRRGKRLRWENKTSGRPVLCGKCETFRIDHGTSRIG